MRLTYIFHSGFAIEGEGFAIVIDYFRDTTESPDKGYVRETLLKREGPLYVLASHFHPDHFNPEILKWKEIKKDIIYIFSKDILKRRKADPEDAFYIRKGDEYRDELLYIKAFGSTDVGISFLIGVEGKMIFHAGDLNNWHWKDESTPQEVKQAEGQYLAELKLLTETTNHLDVAMFPVDARIGSDYARGAEQFVDRITVGLFVPMHFEPAYKQAMAFESYAKAKTKRFFIITKRGDTIEF